MRLLPSFLVVCGSAAVHGRFSAASPPSPPSPSEETECLIRIPSSGSFRILQVADMHYSADDDSCEDIPKEEMPFCSSKNTTDFVKRAIAKTKPNFIVFTGDQTDGGNKDARKSQTEALHPAVESGIPWAAVLGNHDSESTLTRQELMELGRGLPGSCARVGPEGLSGSGNYKVLLKGGGKTVPLFFLDSGDYSSFESVGGYDWIRSDQITWLKEKSRVLRAETEKEKEDLMKGFLFFHIPVPEYKEVKPEAGERGEGVCSAEVNSGLVAGLLEADTVGVTVVGHDHVNDYCGDSHGLKLCYGGGVGYKTYGKVGWPRRVRVFDLSDFGASLSTFKILDTPEMPEEGHATLWTKGKGAEKEGETLDLVVD